MFTLLKVSKAQANNGIYHTRENGDFVQEFFTKDADLVCAVTKSGSYAFFIIECEEGDKLSYGRTLQTIANCRSEEEIYYDAVYVSEMCTELLKQEKPLPSKFENLLADYLPRFFSEVIWYKSNEFNSVTIWGYYEWILEYMGKKANDFVLQSKIDCFFEKMCSVHDAWQISRILPSDVLSISPETSETIERSKKELRETIEIAKKLLSKKSYKDIEYTVGKNPYVFVYAKNTPCGNIRVYVSLEYKFSVSLIMDNNHPYKLSRTDITGECRKFEKNFKCKH